MKTKVVRKKLYDKKKKAKLNLSNPTNSYSNNSGHSMQITSNGTINVSNNYYSNE